MPSPAPPNDPNGWSMCTEDLPDFDRRFIFASGPFVLQPGAVNELIIGVVWVPDFDYPCPDITRILFADDVSQSLFDNCFDITDGPDAPDVDWIELDREIIGVMTNDTVKSNNAFLGYHEPDLQAPDFHPITGEPLEFPDDSYFFEGYLVYQLAGPEVSVGDLGNPDKAKLVQRFDIKNGVREIYNWKPIENVGAGSSEFLWVPELQVQGLDNGLSHTFRITRDEFASGADTRLINHKKYYFTVVAYAYNNYADFNPETGVGQRRPYLQGRSNVKTYTVIPRPITDRKLNTEYGDGATITRVDGVGVGGNFVDISDETRQAILDGSFDGTITYKDGRGPIAVKIYNPLDVVEGEFELTFIDDNLSNNKLDGDVRWQLRRLDDNSAPLVSDTTIDVLNEQILSSFGFSIAIAQTPEAGQAGKGTNGVIGYEEEYAVDGAPTWFAAIPDDLPTNPVGIFNMMATNSGEPDFDKDQDRAFANVGPGYFMPFALTDYRDGRLNAPAFYVTPMWRANGNLIRPGNDVPEQLARLNNVDIVFTSNKDLWSRCVIVETRSERDYDDPVDIFGQPIVGFEVPAEGDRKQFDLRYGLSVGKDDNDGDGYPDPDGTVLLNANGQVVTGSDGNPLPQRGMGWFPGYAIDVETGKRLNIFFGENSAYSRANGFLDQYDGGVPNGDDMMFNPSSQIFLPTPGITSTTIFNFFTGGQHFIFVTDQEYDECESIRQRLDPDIPGNSQFKKVLPLKNITWTSLPITIPGEELLSYAEGLIPNDLTIKLRVDNPYAVSEGTGEFNGYPTYRFKLEGVAPEPLDEVGVQNQLDMINVVPNPYFGFSDYETNEFDNIVKITNLPPKCVVTIYTLDGKFIRQYNRDERGAIPEGNNRGIPAAQVIPDIEWDLKNSRGIPVASGVYLIHVQAEGLGERTLKWFGINRQFDPAGL